MMSRSIPFSLLTCAMTRFRSDGIEHSAPEHQLRAAIDAECGLLTPRGGVWALAADPGGNPSIHDAPTLRAMADRRIRAAMIQVVAQMAARTGWHMHPPRGQGGRAPRSSPIHDGFDGYGRLRRGTGVIHHQKGGTWNADHRLAARTLGTHAAAGYAFE